MKCPTTHKRIRESEVLVEKIVIFWELPPYEIYAEIVENFIQVGGFLIIHQFCYLHKVEPKS